MRYEEFSIMEGKDVFFCNTIKGQAKGGVGERNAWMCHVAYTSNAIAIIGNR